MKIYDCKQGSVEWIEARLGIPTASAFDKIITPTGKLSSQAPAYMHWLIAEKMLNRSLESLQGLEWVERGKELEPQAVKMYEFEQDVQTFPVGFITSDNGDIGCSPDRLAGTDGLVEIKCPAPQTHVGYMLDGFGDKYKPQVQGQMLITGRLWVDRYSYHPEMPPVCERTMRDEPYITLLSDALNAFNWQLAEAIEELENRGLFVRQEKILLPQDTAYEQEKKSILQEIFG